MNTPLDRYLAMLPRNPAGGGMVEQSAIIWDHLLTLQSTDNLAGDMAEIGVFRGFGASLMAGYLRPDESLILVDKFCDLEYSSEAISEVAGPAVLERTIFHQVDSTILARRGNLAPGKELRYFHIDGEHSYDGVVTDLKLAIASLAPHGIVVVDDFFSPASAAITQAVFDFAGDQTNGVALFLVGYNKAYLCLNRWLGHYRRAISTLPDVLEKRGHLVQLAAGGFAHERTYAGISARASENKYQLIGKFIGGVDEFLSPVNRYP